MKGGSVCAVALAAGAGVMLALLLTTEPSRAGKAAAAQLFATSDRCQACHNGLRTPAGEDASIGVDWRASMMANAARDPYWQAAVRREVLDHPSARVAIEDECSKCHMPMARFEARAGGAEGQLFAHLPIGQGAARQDLLAADGVSCSLCHQITAKALGQRSSFVGGFDVDGSRPWGGRKVYGAFDIDRGRAKIMRSASAMQPTRGAHLRQSEVCATCHTLITHTLDAQGQVVGELPEQVPYLEWQHSSYRNSRSCQSCHMPEVAQPMPIASVLGKPREAFSRHVFRGGNFFMMSMLNRYGAELGVAALPQELSATAARTVQHLQSSSAGLVVSCAGSKPGQLDAVVSVANLAGHKLPTAYPSRRVWIHFVVEDAAGRRVFESGAVSSTGAIVGNDNDEDPRRFEPHHERIEQAHQVQIYEAILAAPDGSITTGLLTAIDYAKDNRVLPGGFDKGTASQEIAVHGQASQDADFKGGGDQVRYSVDVSGARGPLRVRAELWYQPVGYRWAHNLGARPAAETKRFVSLYRSMANASAVVLARAPAVACATD